MATYWISGTLPAPWEDFFPEDGNHPKITIKKAKSENIEISDIEGEEGWVDVSLTDVVITREIAVKILELITDEDVVLIESGKVQSV